MKGQCRERVSLVLLVLVVGHELAAGQLSSPIASDSHVSVDGNKFLQRKAEDDAKGTAFEKEEEAADICPQNIQLRWMSEVSSSVYATPLITDLYSDGRKDVIVPSFVHYLEVLEGADGAKAVGWPAFHKSEQHSSPLLYDIDVDGVRDILVATYDGEILFFRDTGEKIGEELRIPRLRVRRHWYANLVDGGTDHSHPDVGSGDDASLYNTFMKHNADALKYNHDSDLHSWGGAGTPPVPRIPDMPPLPARQQGSAAPSPPQPQPPAQKAYADDAGAQTKPAQAAPLPIGSGMNATSEAADAQVQVQVLQYLKQLEDYRKSNGDEDVRRVLENLRDSNPKFFVRVAKSSQFVDDIMRGQATPASAAKASGTRRRLMSLDGDEHTAPSDELTRSARQLQADASLPQEQAVIHPVTADEAALDELHEQHEASPGSHTVADSKQDAGRGLAAEGGAEGQTLGAELGDKLSDEAADSFNVFDGHDYDFMHHTYNDALNDNGFDHESYNWTDQHQYQEHYDDHYVDHHYDHDAALLDHYAGKIANGSELHDEGTEHWRGHHSAYHQLGDYELQQARHPGLGKLDTYDLYDEFGEKLDSGTVAEEADNAEAFKSPFASIHFQDESPGGWAYPPSPGMTESYLYRQKERYDHNFMDDYHEQHPWQYQKMQQHWQDENYHQSAHRAEEQDVYVDAHILTTPAIADIDGDTHEELVVAVSYFYDKLYYDNPEHTAELHGADPGKYIAGGIAVFDLRTRLLKWSQHLDLSTDNTTFKAHIYSAPTLIDLDGDGKLEIIVGTSMGFLYVLDHLGRPREGWPIQMGEIQGQVLVADLNSDGALEIFAADTRGNIALFTIDGKEVWERHVKSLISQGAVAGDVDGDGDLEIVFGTNSGHVYAVRGATGEDIASFPFRTHGRIQAPVMVTRLGSTPSQQLVVMSFDGFLYLIDGITGCADTVDIGESSYSMVLADDLDGNGKLDLLVSTMNGNIYMFETPGDYHPLKTWTSVAMNGLVARHDYFGIYAVASSRQPRDVMGDKLAVKFNIVDKRRTYLKNGTLVVGHGPYNVSVVLKGVGVIEMNTGAQPVIGVVDTLPRPGTYVMEVPCPRTRSTATIRLELTDANHMLVVDEFSLSFHVHFYKLLKWLVALPLLAMAAVVLVLTRTHHEEALPS